VSTTPAVDAVPGAMVPGAAWPGATGGLALPASLPAVCLTLGSPYFQWATQEPYLS
jgi:hypothetical protein